MANVKAHAKAPDGEAGVESEEHQHHGELRERHAHGAHPRAEQQVGQEGRGERREELPRLLEAELLVGLDVGVEDRGEERGRDVHRHDGHEGLCERHLLRREPGREHQPGVRGEGEAERERRRADHDVEEEVHPVEAADVPLRALGPGLRVEPQVGLRKPEGEDRQREDEGVRRLIHAVVGLPHEREQHRRVDEVDEVLDDDVGVAEDCADAALAYHAEITS